MADHTARCRAFVRSGGNSSDFLCALDPGHDGEHRDAYGFTRTSDVAALVAAREAKRQREKHVEATRALGISRDLVQQTRAERDAARADVETRDGLLATQGKELQRLVAERDTAQAALARVEALHVSTTLYEIDPTEGTWVYEDGERKEAGAICASCTPADVLADAEDEGLVDDGRGVAWPCATIRALRGDQQEREAVRDA